MLLRFHHGGEKDWASSCKMQVNADRLFSLAQKDQATPVVKVFCWDAQLCRHARVKKLLVRFSGFLIKLK